jgi:fatty acid CoA ligase FadD9
MGVPPDAYAQLATDVDTIVHNGALVNHAFSYRELFEPNVLGTMEVMKLAVDTRVKALSFLSSISVAFGLDHPRPVNEAEVGTSLATELPGDGGYALGCGDPASRACSASHTKQRGN